jgi:hypothetical protein
MDKNQKIGGKSVVFVLRGKSGHYRLEMIRDGLRKIDFRGDNINKLFEVALESEEFKDAFIED